MFTGSRSDKRTGFLQRAAIAISPLPSLRLFLFSWLLFFPAVGSFSPSLSVLWWRGRAANLEHQVSANEPCKRVSRCSYRAHTVSRAHGSAYKAYTDTRVHRRGLDGSLPRTRQVHLHSRGVLRRRGRRLKRDTRPEVERERGNELNERPTEGRREQREERGMGRVATGGNLNRHSKLRKPLIATSPTCYLDQPSIGGY